jgi:hypothetical protein
LVITNAKTYNAPGTIYFKAAEKLGQFGVRLMEREHQCIGTDEELHELRATEEKPTNDTSGNAGGPSKVVSLSLLY